MWRPLVVLMTLLLVITAIPASVRAGHNDGDVHSDNIRVTGRHQFPYGTDLAFRGNIMVAGAANWDFAYPSGVYVFNVANPEKPNLLSYTPCIGYHSDVGISNNVIVRSHDEGFLNSGCYEGDPTAGKEGVQVFDASDLSSLISAGFAETIHGSHNLRVVGDTNLVYVGSYNLIDPSDIDGVSIVDVADPYNPTVQFLEFPGPDVTGDHPVMKNESGIVSNSPGCHDLSVDMTRNLAYCSGITETQIWDISNPRDPVIIEIIVNPLVNIHHAAYPNRTGNILIIGDEWAGALGGPSGCATPAEEPTGALWFYDISDPRNPVLKSWWSPPAPAPTDDFCTSHFYGVFPDRDYVVSSWYDHGIWVVDFSDPSHPTLVANYDPEGATFWSAYAHRGYIFANSFAPATPIGHDENLHAGGVYVFELDGYTRSDNK